MLIVCGNHAIFKTKVIIHLKTDLGSHTMKYHKLCLVLIKLCYKNKKLVMNYLLSFDQSLL